MGRSDSIVFFDKYIALSQIFVNLQISSNKNLDSESAVQVFSRICGGFLPKFDSLQKKTGG